MIDPRLEIFGAIDDAQKREVLSRLSSTAVSIVADPSIPQRRELMIAVTHATDLLARLFDHVVIDIDCPWADEQNQKAQSLRPLGNAEPTTRVTLGFGDVPADIYAGYSATGAAISVRAPLLCDEGILAALLAGSAAAAEVFKLVFESFLPEIVRADYVIPMTLESDLCPSQGGIVLDAIVAGGGSVGFGVVEALAALDIELRGRVDIIDNGVIEERNLYKYGHLSRQTALSGAYKVAILADRLHTAHPGLEVHPHPVTIENYEGRDAALAIVSMDNVAARRAAQELLTRDIVNIAIDGTEFEVASLTFQQTGCIYCYYQNNREEQADYAAISERFGLDVNRTEHLLTTNEGLISSDIEAISRANILRQDDVSTFLNQPLRSLIQRAAYAQAVIQSQHGSMRLATAFVSSMAGTMGAIEALKSSIPTQRRQRLSAAVDMLGIFHALCERKNAKNPTCAICNSTYRLNEYRRLWGDGGCA
ncbi:MAG TPA: ThiF family adenylyltransferase [Candidatus Baltobacteraceae bacterium]|jgi:hypothetical protein